MARALAADPPILLMDEPFGAVDPIVRERLQNELLRLQETLAKTILFVTHDIDEAIKMGDLVAVMATGGRLLQYGPPSEILARPASSFVAQFVGTDRGLKRLSLARVAELPLRPAITARPGDPAGPARAAHPRRSLPVPAARRRAGPAASGWLDQHALPGEGTLSADRRDPGVARCSIAAPRSRTPCRCCSTRTSRPACSSTAIGRLRGIVTVGMVADWFRADTGGDLPDAPGAGTGPPRPRRVPDP